jgi:hypothetical protein
MKYKKMNEISFYEVNIAFSILIPNGTIKKFEVSDYGDFIQILFKLPYYNMSYSLVLLPDYVVDISNIIAIHENHLWVYQRFMVAKCKSVTNCNQNRLHFSLKINKVTLIFFKLFT